MSKTIEDKAQEFAEINEDKKCNYSFSYNKYDIANAFQNGAQFGYALAENRIKKEYEWKLRWIPVEEFDFKIKYTNSPDIIICKEDNRYSVIEITDLYSINYVKNNFSHCRSFL